MGRKEFIEDFDVVRKALEHALTYPHKDHIGEEGYRAAHEELSKALYSLNRIEKICARLDIGVDTYIPGRKP